MKFTLCFFSLLLFFNCSGQNYVPNSSFEELLTPQCSWNTDDDGTYFWPVSAIGWRQASRGTPDLFTLEVPSNCFANCYSTDGSSIGHQQPRTGKSMAGVYVYHYAGGCDDIFTVNYREFLQIPLSQPLLPGKTYYAEMYVSRAEAFDFAINNIGMSFTVTPISNFINCEPIDTVAQVRSQAVITDTSGWVKICDTFSVQSVSYYLTIGNFSNNANTAWQFLPKPGGSSTWGMSYYFIDDIFVSEFCSPRKFYGSICYSSITLDSYVPHASYKWSNGSDQSSIVVNSLGSYWAEITLGGCTKRDSFFISGTGPVLQFPSDTTICEGETLKLKATGDNDSYLWQDGSQDSEFNVSSPGIYWVQTIHSGCLSRDSINIRVTPRPDAYLGVDQKFCDTTSIKLNPRETDGLFLWQDGSHNPQFNVSSSGSYWVEVFKNGCLARDTIDITISQKPSLSLGNDSAICKDEVVYLIPETDGDTYLWHDGSSDSSFVAIASGKYWVTVTKNGCQSFDTVNIYIHNFQGPYLGEDTIICASDELLLKSVGKYDSYLWSNNSTDTSLSISSPGIYWLRTWKDGCFASDTISIGTEITICQCKIYVPSAFSPNQDGNNEIFRTKTYGCNFVTFEISIFNRWGQLVYFSRDPNKGWDGQVNGTASNSDVFVYLIKYKLPDDRNLKLKKGTLFLIQ